MTRERPEPLGSALRFRWVAPGSARLLLLVFVMLAADPSSLDGQGQGPVGPLRVSEQNPLYRFLYVPDVAPADVVGAGRWWVGLSTQYSSVFEKGGRPTSRLLFDFERMANTLTVRYGPGASTELGGQVTLASRWDGFLDSVVMEFHDFIGVPNGGREDHPRNHYRFELERSGGDEEEMALHFSERRFAFEDMRLFGKWRFYRDPEGGTLFSLRATTRRAGDSFDRGRVSGGISVGGAFSRDRTHVNLQLGYALLNPPDELRPIANEQAVFFSHALEHQLDSGLSLLAQLSGSTPYFHGFEGSPLPGYPMLLTFGMGGRVGRSWQWQLGFAEDILFGGPSVDFTVGLTVSHGFGGAPDRRGPKTSPDPLPE